MSLRVKTPTGEDTALSAFEDPPSTSKARSRSFFPNEERSTMLRRMGLLILSSAVVGICCYTYVASNTILLTSHESVRRRQSYHDDTQCGIYMAPSSIKGLDGYGVFTTRDIEKDTSIFSEPDGPSIPVVDYNRGDWMSTWDEYLWGRGLADHVKYLGYRAMDLQPGFGSMPNHSCILDNLSHRYPKPAYDDSLVNRKDPGAGAFSYSMGRDFFAKKDIKAGDEILLNYGYCNRNDHHGHDWTEYIPMKEDYKEAADIAWAFLQLPNDEDIRVTVPGTQQVSLPCILAFLASTS